MAVYKTDYHIHTSFSDGRDTPEASIRAAVRMGFREIGFSDHLHPVGKPLDWYMNHDRLPEYCDEIIRLGKEHRDIAVRLGIEIDYIPGMEKKTAEFIDAYPFDYVIGSVHYLGVETVDLGPEFYIGRDIDMIYENYFNLVCEAASAGLFDIIGHPDLVRIHRFKPDKDISFLYRMMAAAFDDHDVAFELNTNGRNKPIRDFYPDRKYLDMFEEHKVPVCVNSDAHFPERTGQYFDEAYELLKRSGYREMAVFRNRERYLIPF